MDKIKLDIKNYEVKQKKIMKKQRIVKLPPNFGVQARKISHAQDIYCCVAF